MKQSDKEEEVLQSGLIEKYVLGICEPKERDHIEKLAASDHKIADLIASMRKAMHCYCTSCHSEKIKSIRGSKITHKEHASRGSKGQSKLFKLPCADRPSILISGMGAIMQRLKNTMAKMQERLGLD